MSIFTVDWRGIFKFAQHPRQREDDTLDLGESLLTTLATDSTTLDSLNTTLQTEKKYSCVRIVMQASLNEIFSETTFEVETETNPIRFNYFMTEDEYEAQHLFNENEDSFRTFWMYNEAETPATASIIIRVPAGLYSSNLDGVKEEVQKLKVAGKSVTYVSL